MINTIIPGKHHHVLWCSVPAIALALLMSGCGGGNGGASVPNAAPPTQGNTSSTGTAAAGGGGGAPVGAGNTGPTLRDQIAVLEQTGAYPKLDRSTDIAGPDANSNGVRDDIEAWIQSQKLSLLKTKALMQKARVLQKTLLLDLNDRGALQQSGDALMASSNCGSLHFSPYIEFSKLAGQIEAMTANTRQRAERCMLYNKASSGSSDTLPDGDTCEP